MSKSFVDRAKNHNLTTFCELASIFLLVLFQLLQTRLPIFLLMLASFGGPEKAQFFQLFNALSSQAALLLLGFARTGCFMKDLVLLPRIVDKLAQGRVFFEPNRDEQVPVSRFVVSELP